MRLTIYNKDREIVGEPSKELPQDAVNKFLHSLVRQDDFKHVAQADILAGLTNRWDDVNNRIALFELAQDDLAHYRHYALTEHNDDVKLHWLGAMLDKRLIQWPFKAQTIHYVNNLHEFKSEPRNFFTFPKQSSDMSALSKEVKAEFKRSVEVSSHFRAGLADMLVKSAENPGFLVKIHMEKEDDQFELLKQVKLFNQQAVADKKRTIEVHPLFDPADPCHIQYHTTIKP